MKKIVSLLLCMVVLLGAFVGCDNFSQQPPESTTTPTTAGTTNQDPSVIPPLTVGTFKTYRIVRAESVSSELGLEINSMIQAISNKFGVTMENRDDYVHPTNPKYQEADCEIIVGNCSRSACEKYYAPASLRIADYGYQMDGTKIVLFGGSDAAVINAVKLFVNNVVKAATDTSDTAVLYNNATDAVTKRGTYTIDELTINGNSIADYRIVYPNVNYCFEEDIATRLHTHIKDLTGYDLPLIKDRVAYNGEKEIHIGKTNRDTSYVNGITVADNRYFVRALEQTQILAYAPNAEGMLKASDVLFGFFDVSKATNKKLAIQIEKEATMQSFSVSEKLTVMSFNVWVSEVTSARQERVKTVINTYLPDMFGVQEASPTWMTYLNNNLSGTYAYVGNGRDGNNSGEYSAIFYKKDKFTLLDSGTKWLSDTPNVVSKYSDSACNRIYTYAKLKNKSTGDEFVYINTHLDHVGSDARYKQSTVLKNFIVTQTCPVIVTGDFNCVSSENTYSNMISAGLENASSIAARSSTSPTFPGGGKIIDFIFFSKNDAYVISYNVVSHMLNGQQVSDHCPIYAEFLWKK